MIFGYKKKVWPWSHRKEKGKKKPSIAIIQTFLEIQDVLSCEIFTQNFPLFSTDFQLSTRMLIFRKQNPEADNFLLAFPSLDTSIFTTYLKIASTLRPFERLDFKVTLPQKNFRSLTFLTEEVNSQNGKVFKTFFHSGEQIFYPTVKGKKIIWSKLIQTF